MNYSKNKEQVMQRRTFLKYSTITTTATMFPQLATASWGWKDTEKAVKAAFWASKLNPVRLVAGLVFDEIAEVYVEPLAKRTFHRFLSGVVLSKSSLTFASASSPIITSSTIEHEAYKASLVIYGKTDHEIDKEKQRVYLELSKKYDKERFALMAQYLKDENSKLKLYDRDTTFRAGDDLTPNDLLNIDYIVYGNKASVESNVKNLLEITNNSAFKGVVI